MSQNDLACAPLALIVPICDMPAANSLELPVALVSVETRAGRLALTEAGTTLTPETQTSRVIGCIAVTQEGQKAARSIFESWNEVTGQDLSLIDLSNEKSPDLEAAALRNLSRLCCEKTGAFARHNAELLQMLALMRIEHEEQGVALRKTRNFLLKTVVSRRWLGQAHGPLSQEAEGQFLLETGKDLAQRLTASSAGLSDVGVFLPGQEWAETGTLSARVRRVESDTLAGSWDIRAEGLGPGWLRLTLLDALEDDDQTLQLDLSWDGEKPLLLGAALHHPDQAFCAELAGARQTQMLAHRVWKYMPGARAPLPADGHWTAQPGTAPVYIDPDCLAKALPADPEFSRVQYFPKLEALQVHPRAQGLSAARLTGVVAPGLREIAASIGGRDERVPAVEYALAVAPHHPLRELGDLVADCARRGHLSDWVRLSGDRQGDLCLVLSEPLPQVCDLLLVTRLAPTATPAFGWATFRDIHMRAEPA